MNVNGEARSLAKEYVEVILGALLYSLGFNLLIVPVGLYSTGLLGISQVAVAIVNKLTPASFLIPTNSIGIIYFLINIPLFVLGFKELGRTFIYKSFLAVVLESVLLTVVPIPSTPYISDILTACIAGGVVCGVGCGFVLRGRGSSGGQDIIGLVGAKKYKDFSVGKVSMGISAFVYFICLFMYNIQIVVYSMVYAVVTGLATDRIHIQNILINAMVFTKVDGVDDMILKELNRGVTEWAGKGAYTKEETHVLMVVLSKYEVRYLKKKIHEMDPHAFIILNAGATIDGNFEKKL